MFRPTLYAALALGISACSGSTGSSTSVAGADVGSTAVAADASSDGVATPDAGPSPADGAVAAPDASSAPDVTSAADTAGADVASIPEDLDMAAADFGCILDWPKVRRFRITNLLGHMDETLAVANAVDGGAYPVGTVIQLVPQEAMVKRAAGWSPETRDWEFFALTVTAAGATIDARGKAEVVNAFGGSCFGCHSKSAPQWDLVCEQDHGCAPLPFGADIIEQFQATDARCATR